MKKLILLGAFALALLLGSGCKKEGTDVSTQTEAKKEAVDKTVKANTVALTETNTYPSGADTYPHSTGLCYCGIYSVCHPNGSHWSSCKVGQEVPGTDGLLYGCTCFY